MNRQRSIATWCVAFVALMVMASVTSVRGAQEPELTAQGEKIAAEYTKRLEDLKKEIASLAPGVDEKAKADFDELLSALSNVPPGTRIFSRPASTN